VNVLIVEDNRHMRRMLGEILHAAFDSIQIVEAADAISARVAVRDIRPELILMDIGLPEANGIDLTAEFKLLLPETRVVIVSNHQTRMAQDAASSAGAAAYVFKDDVFEKLLPVLTLVLDQRRAESAGEGAR
jgi:DNA-binding NarL/FixJ family response regulator